MMPNSSVPLWIDDHESSVLLYPRNAGRNKKVALSRRTKTSEVWAAIITQEGTIIVVDSEGITRLELAANIAVCVDLAFDQLDRIFTVWEEAESGLVYMYWFNPQISDYEIKSLGEGSNPCCQIDDYRDINVSNSDILVFYQVGNTIKCRVQRDRFLIEYPVPIDSEDFELDTCGMSTKLRFSVRVISDSGIVLCAGQTPIRIGNNYVGLNWGEIPWDKSYFSMPT